MHTARISQEVLIGAAFDVPVWPAKNPDINIIKNVWSVMLRRIYGVNPLSKMQLHLMQRVGLHIVTDFSISIPILILHFDTDINSIHITIFTKPSYPELGYSALKSRELPSRAPHTAYCNCLCSNNVQRKLPQSLPGQYSHIKFPHFIGVNWYFMVSRVIFCYFIATFLLNTGCKYQFRISFGVCHFDTLDRYRVVTILDRIV